MTLSCKIAYTVCESKYTSYFQTANISDTLNINQIFKQRINSLHLQNSCLQIKTHLISSNAYA